MREGGGKPPFQTCKLTALCGTARRPPVRKSGRAACPRPLYLTNFVLSCSQVSLPYRSPDQLLHLLEAEGLEQVSERARLQKLRRVAPVAAADDDQRQPRR